MRIFITARAGASRELVEELGEGKYKVWVREAPNKGLANKAIIYAMAKHLGVAQTSVSIVSGHTSSHKVLEIKN